MEMETDIKPREEEGKRQRVQANMVNVYIMGKRHVVPEHATIMRAIEYAGHQIIRGAGCREGFCGACGTIYRLPGDYKLHTGLACMTLVEGRDVADADPFRADGKKGLRPGEAQAERGRDPAGLSRHLPLRRLRHVQQVLSAEAAGDGLHPGGHARRHRNGGGHRRSTVSPADCACCAARPRSSSTQVGILAKRLNGRYLRKESKELDDRIVEVRSRKFDAEYAELMVMEGAALTKLYYARDMEP